MVDPYTQAHTTQVGWENSVHDQVHA
jgi:hypothetical protein